MDRFDRKCSVVSSFVQTRAHPAAFASIALSNVAGVCKNFDMGFQITDRVATEGEMTVADNQRMEPTDPGGGEGDERETEEGDDRYVVKAGQDGGQAKLCARGHWRPAEDAKLRELVAQYGPQNWNLMAEKLEGRSGNGYQQQHTHSIFTYIFITRSYIDVSS